MSDYISREALIARINGTGYADQIKSNLLFIAEMIPAADVVEVVHGEWIYGEDDYDDLTYYCSICKEPWTLIEGTPQDNLMNYCPKCGAKMDGGDGDG